MQTKHRLTEHQLQLNASLPWDIYDLSGKLLLRRGFVIQRDTQIDMLLERGMYVDAEAYKAAQRWRDLPPLMVRYDPLSVWHGVQHRLGTLYKQLPQDGSLAGEITELASQVQELCEKSPDLALAALILMDYRKYPIAHSLHVAVLAGLISRRAGWDETRRMAVVCAALTMNVAMAELQQHLCNQREPLDTAQRTIIQTHPGESVKQLMGAGVEDAEWLRAVLEHHENPDGSGYPRQTSHPGLGGLLLHTCDVFAAKVSPRAHRKPMLASVAAKEVFVSMGQGPGNPFPAMLIKEVGIYPPGTIVKLANGEIGVVYKRGPQANAPIVACLINIKGLPHLEPVRRDTSAGPAYQIISVMPRDTALVGLHFEQIWCK